jgi:uncharacterized protein (DUF983 family)
MRELVGVLGGVAGLVLAVVALRDDPALLTVTLVGAVAVGAVAFIMLRRR